jgi:hypothetical protein
MPMCLILIEYIFIVIGVTLVDPKYTNFILHHAQILNGTVEVMEVYLKALP